MALITAMLVVAVTTVAVAQLAGRQLIDIRRTGNLLAADRAQLAARGVEAWALTVLARDRSEDGADHPGEDWAKLLPPTDIEGGTVTGAITDLQGRLNLNSLLAPDGSVSAVALARFQRLLDEADAPATLAQAVVDWMDRDAEPRFPGGAEDTRYLDAEPPYRAANRRFASVTELRLVAGVDAPLYRRLAPLLSAIPDPATAINVNTAPPALLQALGEGITAADAEALVDARRETPFTTVEAFLRHDALAGRQLAEEGLAVGSSWFLAQGQVELGETRAALASLIRRGADGTVAVLRRAHAAEAI